MRRLAFLATIFTTVLVLVLPFVGGGGPGLANPAYSVTAESPMLAATIAPAAAVAPIEAPRVALASTMRIDDATIVAQQKAAADALTHDWEHLAQKPVPKPLPPVTASGAASGTTERRAALEAAGQSCPGNIGVNSSGAPGAVSGGGVAGTTSDDLYSFAAQYNAIRIANCLEPVSYFYYDSCMEQRLFWMAEDPSEDPSSAWGHEGSVRSDGVPSVGCDGNLAGGSGNSGSTVAQKWWDSTSHRASLYRPGDGVGGVCIAFAMTHGGLPNEPYSFTRAAARWSNC
jgi:hypothetical protein